MVALGPRCCGRGQHLSGHRCAGRPLGCAAGLRVTADGCVPTPSVVALPGGTLQLGPVDWEASGRVVAHRARLAPFGLDSHEVTEAAYRRCVEADACAPLPGSGEPGLPQVRITAAEAARYCGWRGGALPTRDQLAFAAMGAAGHRYPWGETGAVCRRVAFGLAAGPCAEGATGPEIAGSHPDGATAEGIYDLAGNAAEWASPTGQAGEARGGSWRDGAASDLRSWSFVRLPALTRSAAVGFRCSYPSARPASK